MFDVREKHLRHIHGSTDDSKINFSFRPDGQVSYDVGVRTLKRFIADILRWMIDDRLLHNDDKIEVLLIETWYQLNKLDHT